ncbi:MAG: hypothetical protein PHS73_00070 [Candidatus Peribacteraceae bacterium]|nr:hypothetical protein [Candidatus Peribacteraceae bacterium]
MTLKHQLRTGWDRVDVRTLFCLEETIDHCLHAQNLTDAQKRRLAIFYRATQSAWVGIFGQHKSYRDIEVRLGDLLESAQDAGDAEFEQLRRRADSLVGDIRACARILMRRALRSIFSRDNGR